LALKPRLSGRASEAQQLVEEQLRALQAPRPSAAASSRGSSRATAVVFCRCYHGGTLGLIGASCFGRMKGLKAIQGKGLFKQVKGLLEYVGIKKKKEAIQEKKVHSHSFPRPGDECALS
jgi:hypothetical protein